MANHLKLANTDLVQRTPGDWAEIESARDILRSRELIRVTDQPAMTMIAGAPGVGKTMAVKRFCEALGHDAVYIQAVRGEGTVWNFAKALSNLWGCAAATFNTHFEAREQLASYIGRGSLLVVDEAQYLRQKNRKTGQTAEAFEWLRAMAEAGGFDVVFCGDLSLPDAIGEMPQLRSRLLRPVVINAVSRADVAAVVEGTAFDNNVAIEALHAVARMQGGLRNVENVTSMATLFAGECAPTPAHLKAAIADMKLAPKGGA